MTRTTRDPAAVPGSHPGAASDFAPPPNVPQPEEIVPAEEPAKRSFVGQVVSFLLRRRTSVTPEKGEIVAQRWLGRLKRGLVPEYEVTIRGKTGREVIAWVSRDHVIPL